MSINVKPKDQAELHDALGSIQAELQAVSEKSGDVVAKVAADLEALNASMLDAKKDAQLARELAENLSRTAPAPKSGDVQSLHLAYDVEHDEAFRGKMDPVQYRLLRATPADLAGAPKDVAAAVRRFQFKSDLVYLLNKIMLGAAQDRAQEFIASGGIKATALWKSYQQDAQVVRAAGEANDRTDTSNWVPTGVGAQLMEDARAQFELLSYIDTVPMARSPMLYPVRGGGFRGYRVPENTAQASQTQIGVRALEDLNMTFTAETIGAMCVTSIELEQDSIVNILAEMRNDLAFAAAQSIEYAVINGQVTAAGSPSTFDTGTNVTTTDDTYCWDGLRYLASLVGSSPDFGTGVVESLLRKMIAVQGRWGRREQNAWVTGYTGFAQLLGLKDGSGRSLVLIPGDYGSAATLPSGSLAALFGCPLVLSDSYPEALNASGVIDGSGTSTGLLRFNRRSFKLGQVMLPTIETSREQFWQFNQVATKINVRCDFQPVQTPSASIPSVVAGVNISTTF